MKRTYLDYGATTPIDKKVLKEMLPFFSEKFGNAMSIHSFGREGTDAVDTARKRAADFFNASPSEIIFTSGATESNNLAIKGSLKSFYSNPENKGVKPHIITTAFEHHCVLDTCKSVEKDGLAEVTFLEIEKDGIISLEKLKKTIRPNTILISIMYVNNEIGTVQPIDKAVKLAKEINPKIIFHTDATQAINYFNCDVKDLGLDMLSMSAHKIYGPKGAGILYVKKGTPVKRIQDGGDQEYKMRSGTHNVPAITGLGKALEILSKTKNRDCENIEKMRNYLIEKVLKEIPKSRLNGSKTKRSPNNANFSFEDVEGEGLLLSLDMEGFACSTGSACSSGALSPSHVLLSIGLKPEQAHGSLRITLGKYTTKKEIDRFIKKLKSTVERLRKISGNVLMDYYNTKTD